MAAPGGANGLSPLSRLLQLGDLDVLGPELTVVDRRWDASQHLMRRWEYALALRAITTYAPEPLVTVDVGGAGSPFWRMVGDQTTTLPIVVDPKCGEDLSGYLQSHPRLADVVTCLSVIEHVADEAQFLYHLSCLVAPGGLLVLTMDAHGDELAEDTCHFHWMRERIYTPLRLWMLVSRLGDLGCVPEAVPDYGSFVPVLATEDATSDGYTFASLVVRKHR